jgi:hypothetical protein
MSQPQPVEVTDEMRRAVYVADCGARGHNFSQLSTMFHMDEMTGNHTLKGPPGKRPHIMCQRCGSVWILAQEEGEEGASYDDAETKFANKLKNAADAKPKPPKS